MLQMTSGTSPRIAFIGFGAIGREMLRCLHQRQQSHLLAGILVRPPRVAEVEQHTLGAVPVVSSSAALVALAPDVVIEAAGHSAIGDYGADVLASGLDLIVCSVGALVDSRLARELTAPREGGGRLLIASGAIAGVDGLLAARTCGLRSVTYTSVKAPEAWIGTPGEALISGRTLRDRHVFFEGTARDAATHYPKNANVSATVALSSIGFERTRVKLAADPTIAGPLGIIEAEGDFGHFRFESLALASPDNPKTSWITGHSLISAALDGMCFHLSGPIA